MTIPDRETIAEVMLFAQGYQSAEMLSLKVVPLFRLCEDQFSRQAHYDFGLRALKSVLTAAGSRKRSSDSESGGKKSGEAYESNLLLESIVATIAPKLVTQDVSLFYPLLHDFFPDQPLPALFTKAIKEAVEQMCVENGMSPSPAWIEKICQLYHTKETRHGTMIVGPSGTGKTAAWKSLAAARWCESIDS
ncbi:hypothetical protein AGDE_13563 [Angomonas deanei]|nr:hypothetical protein AGDE_13563 [Angomonas deanei]|eukprot:EPY22088.1 hypothetical protein AGDE_13563 [Angomonas deanei]